MRPTFIGIGGQKCASTWIHDILTTHPDFALPGGDTKEVDFFSYRFENGFRWYERQFDAAKPVRGEISPSYLHEPGVVERAHAYEPRLRIVVSLRDPVARALSQHRHMVRLGMVPEDDPSFEAALTTNPTYVEQGLYHRHLRRWIEAFGRAQVLVILFEEIERDGPDVARRVYSFLGASTDHASPALLVNRNESYVPRHAVIEAAVRGVREAVRSAGAGALWQRLGDAGLRDVYRSANRRASQTVIPTPRPETLAHLRVTFRDDIEQLQSLLQRDLSPWLAV